MVKPPSGIEPKSLLFLNNKKTKPPDLVLLVDII